MRELYDTSHGKFDSNICAYVYDRALLEWGMSDEGVSNEFDGGWCDRIGKRIIEGDSQGFVYLTRFDSVAEAEARFAEIADSDYFRDEELDDHEDWPDAAHSVSAGEEE